MMYAFIVFPFANVQFSVNKNKQSEKEECIMPT